MNILITAGPTREAIDPVRYISNRSSGKMGYSLCQAALDRGHHVTLISGPVSLTPPVGADVLNVISAQDMYAAVERHIVGMDASVPFAVKAAGGLKTTVFGGEGLVCQLTGPGRVLMQSRSEQAFLGWLLPKLPKPSSS